MFKFLVVAVATVLLAGCAQPSAWAWLEAGGRRPSDAAPRQFAFDWRIDGEPGLAPLQVFDDGERTWLQYPSDQAAPALFERTAHGDRLLAPARQGDYLVIEGVPAHLVMRGGHLMAEARRGDAAGSMSPTALRDRGGEPGAASLPVEAFDDEAPLAAAVPVPAPMPPSVPRPVPVPPPATPEFQAGPGDVNMRRALGRWARDAGWVFEAEHWAVDVDIPLAGSAAFGDAFRPAVRALLAATELGERPLQPCFYANRVLRVIPLAQRCDRTSGGRPS
uniref:TcpQ domain-containing protein n=1 Tax=Castellaniella defragrans TaxID=75697 RepID=UPI0033419912